VTDDRHNRRSYLDYPGGDSLRRLLPFDEKNPATLATRSKGVAKSVGAFVSLGVPFRSVDGVWRHCVPSSSGLFGYGVSLASGKSSALSARPAERDGADSLRHVGALLGADFCRGAFPSPTGGKAREQDLILMLR